MKQKFDVHEHPEKRVRKERRMAYRAGHDLVRSSYHYEDIERLSHPTSWLCCNMVLPTSFFLCPICGREQDMEDEDTILYIYD